MRSIIAGVIRDIFRRRRGAYPVWGVVVAMLVCAVNGFAAKAPELTADQAKALEEARSSALAYSRSLPDFICRQITQRETWSLSASAALASGWNGNGNARLPMTSLLDTGDIIEEQLTFIGLKENYQVLTVNGKKAEGLKHAQLRGMISAGEFGSALEEIFRPQSKAEFTWGRMGKVRGRRVYVFGFHVPVEQGATVMLRSPNEMIKVSYGGQVAVDVENLNVLEIRSSLDLPLSSGLQKGESTVEYGQVRIAGKSYSLPLHSEVLMQDKEYVYRNSIDFKNYRKFAVESTIHYGSAQ